MFERSGVRILALYTVWTFFTLICCKNCIVCVKRPGLGHFLKSTALLCLAIGHIGQELHLSACTYTQGQKKEMTAAAEAAEAVAMLKKSLKMPV